MQRYGPSFFRFFVRPITIRISYATHRLPVSNSSKIQILIAADLIPSLLKCLGASFRLVLFLARARTPSSLRIIARQAQLELREAGQKQIVDKKEEKQRERRIVDSSWSPRRKTCWKTVPGRSLRYVYQQSAKKHSL